MFWALDRYFLRQEHLTRALYNFVGQKDVGKIDFSMDTRPVTGQVSAYLRVCLSSTLLAFHGILLATVFLVL